MTGNPERRHDVFIYEKSDATADDAESALELVRFSGGKPECIAFQGDD